MELALEDWLSILVILQAAAIMALSAVYVYRHKGRARSRIHAIVGFAALVLLVSYVLYLANALRMGTGGGYYLLGALVLFLAASLAEIIVDL